MINEIKSSFNNADKLMQLKKACRGFEEIMVQKMLEEMDKSIPKDPLIKNDAQNSIYKSMYINAMSKKISDTSPFGIGKMLFNSLKAYVEYKKDAPLKKLKVKSLKMEMDFKPIKSNTNMKLIQKVINKAAKRYSVPKNLIYGIIKTESNFNPKAVSKAGAIGLMQLMPQTAADMGVNNIWDAQQNIMAGVKYVSKLINRFKNTKLAIAAYNAGPENVQKYNGVPPFSETKNYVKKVLAYANNKY